nr:autotransporter-associated beta strand repeat-containing protein [Thermoguttaceae bacterium]
MAHFKSFKSVILFLALLASPVFAEDFSYTLTTADQALNLTTTAGNTYTVNFPSIAAGSSLSGFTYSGDGTVILKGPEGRINISTNNSGFTGTLVVDSARISSSGNMGSGTILLQNGGNLMNSGGASNYTQNIQLGTGAGGFKAGWSTTLTLSGVISDYTGVSGVLKDIADNGSVVINNAANTYTGGTIIAKQIDIGTAAANGTPLGTGSVSFSESVGILDLKGQTITIGGLDATTGTVKTSSGSPTLTLNVPTGAEYTYTGAISGAVSIVKSGAGTQIFGASAKGYTGKTTVTGGTLKLADGVSSYSAATLNGGTLSVDTSSGIVLTVQKDGGTFDWRASGTTAVSVALKGDSTTTADTVFTFNGITNPTGNCNTLKISSVTDYPGKIRLSGGKWSVDNTNQLPSGAIILDGGTFMMNSTSGFTVPNNFEITATGGSLRPGGNPGVYKLTGTITGTGELGISCDNSTIVLANSGNTFSGGLNLGVPYNANGSSATVKLGADNALGSGVVTVTNAGATLDLAGYSVTTTPIAGLSTTLAEADIKNSSSTASTLTLNVPDGQTYSYVGNLSGKINLVKGGEGTQILGASAKGYTGTTTITGGTLKLADGVSSYSAATLNGGTLSVDTSSGITLTVQKDGGTLDWRAGGTAGISVTLKGDETTTADTVFTFHGITNPAGNCNTMNISSVTDYPGKIKISGGKWNVSNTNQIPSGTIILDGGTFMMNIQSGSEFTVPNNFEITSTGGSLRPGGGGSRVYKLTGTITGTGELGISCDNTTFVLANSGNTFSGGLNLGVPYNASGDSAIVKLGANNAIGSGLVTVTKAGAKLDLAGYSVTTRPIAGLSTTLAGADIKNSSSTASTLTLDVAEGNSYSYVGKLSGKINLVKNGAGEQIISGTGITFSGLMTVGAGTLDLPGVTLSSLSGLSGTSASAILKNSKTDGTTALTLNTTSDQSYAGQISGKFSITKTGSAKQTLNGSKLDANFAAKISEGTLALTSAPATQNGSYTLDGGTFNVTTSETTAVKLANALKTTANGGTVIFNASGTPRLELGTLSGNGDANTLITLTTRDNATGNCPSFYFTVPASYLGKVEVTGGKWVITNGSVLPKAGVILSGGEIMGG